MTPSYARAPRGQRAFDTTLRNYGHNLTLLSGLRLSGIEASLVIEGAVNSAVFEAYVRQVLGPIGSLLTRGRSWGKPRAGGKA